MPKQLFFSIDFGCSKEKGASFSLCSLMNQPFNLCLHRISVLKERTRVPSRSANSGLLWAT